MTEVHRVIEAPPEVVFDVLADGWSYAGWVVGSSHIRDVDPRWPDVGTRIHHSVGPWPMHIHDTTTVTEVEPGKRLALSAQAWPLGVAEVVVTLEPQGPRATLVRMAERTVRGPGRFVPGPIQDWVLRPRNKESLARLSDVALGRVRERRNQA